jgi:CelD/BcsL family acetyltransferase involved in cellulose biosynthesis
MSEPSRTCGTPGNIVVERIDPFAKDGTWDNQVCAHNDHSVFHRSEWARVLVETYGHRPFYLRVLYNERNAALVPLMEVNSCFTGRRGVSLPFSDYTGVLWTDARQASSVYRALFEFASDQKWKHVEIRGARIPPVAAKPFQTYQSNLLDLSQGIESISRHVDPSVRTAIRKAERSGIEVSVEQSLEAMDAFYKLHGRTRRRHGLPPQPASFFRSIARNLVGAGLGSIVLAKLGGIPVAGAVFLHSAGRVIYKFGASDVEHWPLRPNQMVMWAAIRAFVEAGYQELQFGRTSPTDQGLIRFKRSWGSTSQALSYFRYGCRNNLWLVNKQPPSESYPLIFGHLPIVCNRLAGRLIYPHLD